MRWRPSSPLLQAEIDGLLDLRTAWPSRKGLSYGVGATGKRQWEAACASGFPGEVRALPTVPVTVFDSSVPVYALVDTGCTQSLISSSSMRDISSAPTTPGGKLITVDGSPVKCGKALVRMKVEGKPISVQCLVMETLVTRFDLILGMDVVKRLGGLKLCCGDGGTVQFGLAAQATETKVVPRVKEAEMTIDDVDFSAHFDGMKWTVKWNWSASEPNLSNKVSCYRVRADLKKQFDDEVQSWIKGRYSCSCSRV